MSTNRRKLEAQGQAVARIVHQMIPPDCAFCVLLWGPDKDGQQWRTWVHNTLPEADPRAELAGRRVALARELREIADAIETRADVPPGAAGRG